MGHNIARVFQTSSRALLRYVGVPIEELVVSNGTAMAQQWHSNGTDGGQWSAVTDSVCNEIEKADPRIVAANIQGSRAHVSSKDRSDNQNVITVGLETHTGTRIGSLHVHLDGTFKFFPSSAGKEGGYGSKIASAGIKGFIPTDSGFENMGEQSSSSK
ncbi:hypothetical protein MGYG_07875 [Nannizzia gypsea CBS 118893]|uniref:Uncharacterized protein n=1 Tax=Arthroderma gypseum (strain ATCC MYA-4604 / CBS 118893) TaxID=535722 RepID=E4V4E8_ARTGP|nr:hypothetical protein MGYG_07875 [Nannizzia gypsea CBS 118893]EFR04872.1 hypothetical protein MGYG_07875 [Nannizzia gypsea CBS 118893]